MPGDQITTAGDPWLADRLRDSYEPVLVILAPPRSGSTALARAFWQHPSFGWYLHEPYDTTYHRDAGQAELAAALDNPLALTDLRATPQGRGLVLKEMTFQVGSAVGDMFAAATTPVIITIRDPRLSIQSRMRRREADGLPAEFPSVETGWPDLMTAVAGADRRSDAYVVVDTTMLRNRPQGTLSALCEKIGLPYSHHMSHWPVAPNMRLGQLDEGQLRWYARVLGSTGFLPATEEVPEVEDFPKGMRSHVVECLDAYQTLLTSPHMVQA